ncbi:MAG: YhcH/YjgK/YiaL family protein, partial [Duncaniella sp.]|nr:YhcH/YjgK/YiaL family protein [Duncaniella sp.]
VHSYNLDTRVVKKMDLPIGETDYVPATPDRFFLYFPGELHQPSVILEGTAVPSRKIVGKIEYCAL